MPLPLIVPVALGLAGLFGIGKTVKAVVDNSDAKDIRDEAEEIVNSAKRKLEVARTHSNTLLTTLGQLKLDVFNGTLTDFVDLYERIATIKPLKYAEMKSFLGEDIFPNQLLSDIKEGCKIANEVAYGLSSGLVGGGLTALAAYGGTMAFAAAGTGTAISALSGVAATNATLAWLGGGTLASGGLGMAGGAMVLGAMVAGPLLAIFGSVLGSKAAENLSNARSARSEAKVYEKETDVVRSTLHQMNQVIELAEKTLTRMDAQLAKYILWLKGLLDFLGEEVKNPTTFDATLSLDTTYKGLINAAINEKFDKLLYLAVKQAQIVKTIIDIQILDDEGKLLPNVEGTLQNFFNAPD
ncbi:MAG: hypothetical protein LBI10_11905 [Deltaproteobacteria bacterium]|jgi:hypothetical protein|nr:hypothetical protein [Deltaproteobacteria bacterium]